MFFAATLHKFIYINIYGYVILDSYESVHSTLFTSRRLEQIYQAKSLYCTIKFYRTQIYILERLSHLQEDTLINVRSAFQT